MEVDDVELNSDPSLADIHKWMVQAIIPARGQKKLIKHLLSNVNQVTREASRRDIVMAISTPSFIESAEGRKLALALVPEVGIKTVWNIIHRLAADKTSDRKVLENYGELLLMAWKKADEGEREKILDVYQDAVYYSLCVKSDIAKNHAAVLEPMRKARCKQIDSVIFQMMLPNIWRSLKTNAEFMARQQESLFELLTDESVDIRIEAVKGVLSILSSYWVTFDASYIRRVLAMIVDNLSKDSVVAVRVAVFEGFRHLLPCSNAVNAILKSFKHLIPRHINDPSDKVRLAVFELLTAIQGHRFIHYWDVIDMNTILQCFGVEEADSVKKQITKLLFQSFKPDQSHPDELIRRIIFMGNTTRMGALYFHGIMITAKLITVEQALEHAQTLAIAIYKALRALCGKADSLPLTQNETMNETIGSIAAQIDSDSNEEAQNWRNTSILLDCLIAMLIPLREQLLETDCPTERIRMMNILSKLFKMLFKHFLNTSLFDSLMLLGSLLDEQSDISAVVIKDLFSHQLVDEKRILLYLQLASAWNFGKLLDIVHSGLQIITTSCQATGNQCKRKQNNVECSISRALLCLEHMLCQMAMQSKLIAEHEVYLQTFYRKDEEMCLQINKDIEQDAVWFVEQILPKLTTLIDSDEAGFFMDFVVRWLIICDGNLQVSPMSANYKAAVVDVITMLTTKNTPSNFIVPILSLMKSLFYQTMRGSKEDNLMEDTLLPLTRSSLEWICERVEDSDFDSKECLMSFLKLLVVLKLRGYLSESILVEYAKLIIATVLPVLINLNEKELDVIDPRHHTFDTPQVVNFLLGGIVFKNGQIHSAVMNILLTMIKSDELVGRYKDEDLVFVYGAMLQTVILCEMNAKKEKADDVKAILNGICRKIEKLGNELKYKDVYARSLVASSKLDSRPSKSRKKLLAARGGRISLVLFDDVVGFSISLTGNNVCLLERNRLRQRTLSKEDLSRVLETQIERSESRLATAESVAQFFNDLCVAIKNADRIDDEELFTAICKRVIRYLLSDFQCIRAISMRVLRLACTNESSLIVLLNNHVDIFLARSLDLDVENFDERVEALKLSSHLLSLYSQINKGCVPDVASHLLFPHSLILPILAIARTIFATDDDKAVNTKPDGLASASLAVFIEMAISEPDIIIDAAGTGWIVEALAGPIVRNSKISAVLCRMLYTWLDCPRLRAKAKMHMVLEQIFAPLIEIGFFQSSSLFKEVKAAVSPQQIADMLTGFTRSFSIVLSSWSGLLACAASDQSTKTVVSSQLRLLGFLGLGTVVNPNLKRIRGMIVDACSTMHYPDSFKCSLRDDFVLSEHEVQLASNNRFTDHVDLLASFKAVAIFFLIDAGFAQSLARLILVDPQDAISIKATLLLSDLLLMSSSFLPLEWRSRVLCMPTLIQSACETLTRTNDCCISSTHANINALNESSDAHEGSDYTFINAGSTQPIPIGNLELFVQSSPLQRNRSVSLSKFQIDRRDGENGIDSCIHDMIIKSVDPDEQFRWPVVDGVLQLLEMDACASLFRHRHSERCFMFFSQLLHYFKPSSGVFLARFDGDRFSVACGCRAFRVIMPLCAVEPRYEQLVQDFLTDFVENLEISKLSRGVFSTKSISNSGAMYFFALIGAISSQECGRKLMERTQLLQTSVHCPHANFMFYSPNLYLHI
ncbi:unnamed protein product [Anisakis simplex]|uniref:RICTOR_N domain-containing protein n=1 Tax=Anisakis simplex TaxID=6269 RepID=A0A158PMV5_ANISI|nr:unnamed protein product [Anisakis simplex]